MWKGFGFWQVKVRDRDGGMWGYVLAVAIAAVALAIRLAIDPWLGNHLPWVTFFFAVIIAGWWIGWRAAALTALCGLVGGFWFAIPPQGSFGAVSSENWVRLAGYCIVGGTLVLLFRAMQREQRRVEAATEALDQQKQEMRQAEADLARTANLLRALSETTPEPLYAKDREGRVLFANPATYRAIGKPEEQVLRRTDSEWLDNPRQAAAIIENDRRVMESGRTQVVEEELTTPSGTRVFLGTKSPLQNAAGQVVGLVGLSQDITERKLAERALQKQNQRLGLLNEAAAHLLSAAEPGRAMASFFPRIANYFQADVFLTYRVDGAGDALELEACGGVSEELQRKLARLEFGQLICGTAALRREPIVISDIQHCDDPIAQLPRQLGFRVYACDPVLAGDRLLGIVSFGSRQRDTFEPEDEQFFHTLANFVAMAKERVRLTGELCRHAESLERIVGERTIKLQEMVGELEHFSYSITHDMRAPLRAMQGFAQLLLMRCQDCLGNNGQDYVRRIMSASQRMDQLITDALQYSLAVRNELPLAPVDAGRLLRGIVETYPQFQPPAAEIRLEGDFPPVLGNEAGLTQCFSNLLSNAVKFVEPGKLPQIRIWAETVCSPQSTVHSPQSTVRSIQHPASSIRLWFQDNGIGIPRESQERIFDMFQRMHSGYEGTGIGLALVRKVAQRMGGRAGVESEPGKGSRFWVELKAASEDAALKHAA